MKQLDKLNISSLSSNNTKLSAMKKLITIVILIVFIANPFTIHAQETIVTVKAQGPDQYENIQYKGIEVSQIIDFSNLIRVYINKASVILIDNGPVAFDSTEVSIKNILIADLNKKHGNITPENIDSARCDLKLLVRKSSYTKREDYRAFLSMINDAIWGLQKYYSNKVYARSYTSLTQEQKDSINRLVPLNNLLAKDNTD